MQTPAEVRFVVRYDAYLPHSPGLELGRFFSAFP